MINVDSFLRTNLDDIFIFVKVVQLGSFTKASKFFDLPRSSISRKVARLEKELNVTLLERTTRSLRLSPVGSTYFQYAERALNELEMAQNSLDQIIRPPKGKLRIFTNNKLGQLFLSPIFSDFIIQHPEVNCIIHYENRAVDIITEGYDAVIQEKDYNEDTLSMDLLGTIENGLFASPLYLQKREKIEEPNDLKKHKLLQIKTFNEGVEWEFLKPKKLTIRREARLSTNDTNVILDACIKGVGIAKFPKLAIQEELTRGILVPVLEDHQLKTTEIKAYFPTFKSISPTLKAFFTYIKQSLEF